MTNKSYIRELLCYQKHFAYGFLTLTFFFFFDFCNALAYNIDFSSIREDIFNFFSLILYRQKYYNDEIKEKHLKNTVPILC